MHYYKFNVPDWVLHTSHLTPQEEGIYLRLLNHYYDSEAPIPEETEPVIRRLRLIGFEEKVNAILSEYFQLKEGFWYHKRCEKEVLAYQTKAEANRENGKKGGRPKGSGHSQAPKDKPNKTQRVSAGNPNKTLTKNYKQVTNNQTLSKSPKGDHMRFDEFYLAYPRKAAKAQALKAWNKLKPDDTLINRILDDIPRRMASGEFDADDKIHIPHPATYLNGRRWEDEIIPRGVLHDPNQQIAGGRQLSAVDRVRLASEQRERKIDAEIEAIEAGEELGAHVDQTGRDVWPPVDQPVWENDAGNLENPSEGVLVN